MWYSFIFYFSYDKILLKYFRYISKKINDKSQYYQVDVSTVFSTLELSSAIGKARKVLAITDAGFTKKMRSIMQ